MAPDNAGGRPAGEQGDGLGILAASEVLGVSPHTLRYYERIGLLEVPRDANGHRRFDRRALDRLTFLVRMRSSGMGIEDLRAYVRLVEQGDATTAERLALMQAHRRRIEQRIDELQAALAATRYKITTYGGRLGTPSESHPQESEGQS